MSLRRNFFFLSCENLHLPVCAFERLNKENELSGRVEICISLTGKPIEKIGFEPACF